MKRISERTIEYNGYLFTRGKDRKYYRNTKLKTDLHRYIYTIEKGAVKDGCHVHHIDFDTENNSIDNLICISEKKHYKIHYEKMTEERKKQLKEHADKIRPLTKEWHGSEKGKEWHKKHYEKMKCKLYVKRKFKCDECGEEFESTQSRSRFCSNACKSKFRRKSGVDDVERVCEYCGEVFKVNKYSKTKFCSKSCSKKK